MRKLLLSLLCLCIAPSGLANAKRIEKTIDVVLVGAGIMSATLGALLKELEPDISIEIFEKLEAVALESSSAWNNAGTGHAAYCELNYTPERADGTIDIKKALEINESFEISKQFWAFLIEQKKILSPQSFINRVPHISFVWGDANVAFLKKRYAALSQQPLFKGMEYSEDRDQLTQWMPLVMEGRSASQKVAATRMQLGTDVNFGTLTQDLMAILLRSGNATLHLNHEVMDIKQNADATWNIVVKDLKKNTKQSVKAKFVFIGAGGGTLAPLQRSGIVESKGFGGVPVGGQWLVTDNPTLLSQHSAKVYGKAALGSPPMSVPHLDTRIINGKKALLFGPFATFAVKLLKNGSWLGFVETITLENIVPMAEAGWHNLALTQYLITQLLLTPEQRLAALQEYFPNAKMADWRLETAGQRVQMVKDDPETGGFLQFGTELVSSKDGSLVALLGASPGASTAVDLMLRLLDKSFKEKLTSPSWQLKLKKMIPSYGHKLSEDPELLDKVRQWDNAVIGLTLSEKHP